MTTYESILNELNLLADLSKSAVRISAQDFSLDENFIITLIMKDNELTLYYASQTQCYSKPLSQLDEDLLTEVLMLLTESDQDDIEVIGMEEVWEKYDEELRMITENPFRISEVKNPSYDLILTAAKINGFIIQYFDKLPLSILMAAVKQNGLSLEFIEDQTYELCHAALEQNALAILFVDEQDEELCEIAKRWGAEQVLNGEITQEKYEFDILNVCEY